MYQLWYTQGCTEAIHEPLSHRAVLAHLRDDPDRRPDHRCGTLVPVCGTIEQMQRRYIGAALVGTGLDNRALVAEAGDGDLEVLTEMREGLAPDVPPRTRTVRNPPQVTI